MKKLIAVPIDNFRFLELNQAKNESRKIIIGQGVVINEPSVVALNTKTNRVVAVGNDAREMLGRNPGHIRVVRPLVDGVISDFDVTEEMLSYLIRKAESKSKKFFRPS